MPQKKWSSHHGQQKSPKCSTWMQSEKQQNDLCSSSRQTIAKSMPQPVTLRKLKLNGFMKTYRGLHKDIFFIIGDWNAKVGSQETPGVTGKFGLGMRNEAGQRLIEFCQQNALVIANTLFQQNKRRLYTWTSPDGQH